MRQHCIITSFLRLKQARIRSPSFRAVDNPPAHEANESQVLFDLAKGRLDRLLGLFDYGLPLVQTLFLLSPAYRGNKNQAIPRAFMAAVAGSP